MKRETVERASVLWRNGGTFLEASYLRLIFLQLNPSALQRMREAKSGYAVFVVSDDNINAYYTEQFGLLESACVDEELQQIVQRMAAYHRSYLLCTTTCTFVRTWT